MDNFKKGDRVRITSDIDVSPGASVGEEIVLTGSKGIITGETQLSKSYGNVSTIHEIKIDDFGSYLLHPSEFEKA